MKDDNDGDTNHSWSPWNRSQESEKRLDKLKIKERIEKI